MAGHVEVVGELSYQKALWRIVGGLQRGKPRWSGQARLTPEPRNPQDSNAVRVVIEGETVGHLDRELAAVLQPAIRQIEREQGPVLVYCSSKGGHTLSDGERAHIGIVLEFDPQELLDAVRPARKTTPAVRRSAPPPRQLVEAVDGEIRVNARNVQEAKLALKELRLLKKEYTLVRRAATSDLRAIKAEYTDDTRRRMPMIRGLGTFGQVVRAMQTANRVGARIGLANQVAPVEAQRAELDAIIRVIDAAIIQVEIYIVRES